MSARWVAAAAIILAGCSGYSITGGPGKTASPSLQSTTLLPEDLKRVHLVYLMPVSFDAAVRDLEADQSIFLRELQNVLVGECGLAVAVEPQGAQGPARPSSSLDDALKAAEKVGADAVLATKIIQYDLREGSSLAADRPATVFFSMKLHRRGDGREVWRGTYFYKDQAWSDNLFRMGQRFAKRSHLGWLKADEILHEGFLSACRDFGGAGRMEKVSGQGAATR